MTTDAEEWQQVLKLLNEQSFGVLGTNHKGHPYASLVAFAATAEAQFLYFATTRATRKYLNLAADGQVALLVDNRTGQALALYETVAVTAYGTATEVETAEHTEVLKHYLAKHPQLKSFVSSPTTAIFRIKVDCYHLVQRFQSVTEFWMDQCTG
jgi:nitroimidazol reductase NimA-like FMN-containing flavoprotein (pyridoxamine 5'-phosphate oxidase superfamily)